MGRGRAISKKKQPCNFLWIILLSWLDSEHPQKSKSPKASKSGCDSTQVFYHLTKEQYKEVRKNCIESILHTDMMAHQAWGKFWWDLGTKIEPSINQAATPALVSNYGFNSWKGYLDCTEEQRYWSRKVGAQLSNDILYRYRFWWINITKLESMILSDKNSLSMPISIFTVSLSSGLSSKLHLYCGSSISFRWDCEKGRRLVIFADLRRC